MDLHLTDVTASSISVQPMRPDRAVDHLRGIRGVAREEREQAIVERPHEANA
jgi:hypothetical protein